MWDLKHGQSANDALASFQAWGGGGGGGQCPGGEANDTCSSSAMLWLLF